MTNVNKWRNDSRLSYNVKKTVCMRFTKTNCACCSSSKLFIKWFILGFSPNFARSKAILKFEDHHF